MFVVLVLAGCSHPARVAPVDDGWSAMSWTYHNQPGRDCGRLDKQFGDSYAILIFDGNGAVEFSSIGRFKSDDEAKKMLQQICDGR